MEQLEKLNEKSVVILDIDLKHGPNSISVELQERNMVDILKKLNGIICLGEKLIVRKLDEETATTSAQAAAITLAVMK